MSVFLFIAVTIIMLSLIFLGPRVKVTTNLKRYEVPDDIGKLDQYLKNQEEKIPEIIVNTEKNIHWYNQEKKKTKSAIIYIHGFSASRQDIAPVVDNVAKCLKANIYYCRLKGHGIKNPDALKEPTVNDWINDVYEGYEIARRIGDRTIIIASSTGSPLALWLYQKFHDIASIVLLSPNFKPANWSSQLLLLPYGKLLARLFIGKYEVCDIMNDQHGKYWTRKFHSEAYVTMMGICKLMKKIKMKQISIPVLFLYSPKDKLISIPMMLKVYNQINSKDKKITGIDSPYHVIAGDIVSPETTEIVTKTIKEFLEKYV